MKPIEENENALYSPTPSAQTDKLKEVFKTSGIVLALLTVIGIVWMGAIL